MEERSWGPGWCMGWDGVWGCLLGEGALLGREGRDGEGASLNLGKQPFCRRAEGMEEESKSDSREEVRAVGREGKGKRREREGSQQVGVMGEALEMLPFTQEQTKHPCIASSYSF